MGPCLSKGVLFKMNIQLQELGNKKIENSSPKSMLKSTRLLQKSVRITEEQSTAHPDDILSYDVIEDFLKHDGKILDFWKFLTTDQSSASPDSKKNFDSDWLIREMTVEESCSNHDLKSESLEPSAEPKEENSAVNEAVRRVKSDSK